MKMNDTMRNLTIDELERVAGGLQSAAWGAIAPKKPTATAAGAGIAKVGAGWMMFCWGE